MNKKELNLQDAEMFRSLVVGIRDFCIMFLDLEGNLTSWNQGAENLFLYGEEEVLGKNFSILFTPSDREKEMPQKELAIAKAEGSAEDDNWVLRKDGTFFWASGISTYIDAHNGKPAYYAKVIRDLTEYKKIEQDKDNFIALVSHELRNPLHNIKLSSMILEERLHDAEPVIRAELAQIVRQTRSLEALVADLLEEARTRARSFTFHDEIFALDELVDEVIQHTTRLYPTYLIKSEGELDKRILADRQKIGEVIDNFLTNAIKFSKEASVITVRALPSSEGLIISVEDHGIGISEELLTEIFEPFFKAMGGIDGIDPSIGLGLHIAKEIVRHYKGRIWAESTLGEGATFSILIPKEMIK